MLWNDASVEQVRRVHGMAGGPQVVGEGAHAGGQPLGVVEEQDLGHGGLRVGCHGRSTGFVVTIPAA